MNTERAILVSTTAAGSAAVEVYEICVGLNEADLRGFEIRTSTGYRAVFPEAHTECTRTPCVKVGCWDSHRGEARCHGVHHLEQVQVLAREVAATYAPKRATARPAKAPAEWTAARFEAVAARLSGPSDVTAEWLG